MWQVLVASLSGVVALDLVIAYLPAWGEANGFPAAFVAGLLVVRGGFALLGRIGLPRIVARFGYRMVCVACSTALALSFALLYWSGWAAVAVMAVIGVALAVGQTVTLSWAATLSAPGTRAKAMAVRLVANRCAQVAIPLTASLLLLGPLGVFLMIAALASIAAVSASTAPEPPDDIGLDSPNAS